MKIRNLLFAFVLATMLLCTGIGSTASPAAPSCGSNCVQNYNFCKSTCGSDPICLAHCKEEYDCCQLICHGQSCFAKSSKK